MAIFGPTRWATTHRVAVYFLTLFIVVAGSMAYLRLPKELFPDIVVPTVVVSTVYPGASPGDIENLVTRPIERQLKSVSGVEKITSVSQQDLSVVTVEFALSKSPKEAKDLVRDAVDKAKADLPKDLPKDPEIRDIDFSEIPILFVNLSGDMEPDKLKYFADQLKDRIEVLPEVRRVDVLGALEKEIQVHVDPYKLSAAGLSFGDIESAIARENILISAGKLPLGYSERTLRVDGEFRGVNELENIVVRSGLGGKIYLRDVARIQEGYKERESYALLNGKPVISLSVIKKAGENLVAASDKIREILDQATFLPPTLQITLTNDQSDRTRVQLDDLVNSIILGFTLVTLVMMFFVQLENALFVGLSVPLSSFVALLLFPSMGYTLNLVVLFTFLFALGIVVDDAIVVVENTYRIYDNGKKNILQAAQEAATEVVGPVISGTLITAMPFLPLLFWESLPGKFLRALPVTILIVLFASLFVAYIINPVFAVDFMRPQRKSLRLSKLQWMAIGFFGGIGVMLHLVGVRAGANLSLFFAVMIMVAQWVLKPLIAAFQERTLPKLMSGYEKLLRWSIARPRHVYYVLSGVVVFFVMSFFIFVFLRPPVVFFPAPDPNYIYVYAKLPEGTALSYTYQVGQLIQKRVEEVLGQKNPLVSFVQLNVGLGVNPPTEAQFAPQSNKAKVTVGFVEYRKRQGKSTRVYLEAIEEALKGIPAAEIVVEADRAGPPAGKPVQIEISGEDKEQVIQTSQALRRYLDSLSIPGLPPLSSDLVQTKPEIRVVIDKERAGRIGITSAQIGADLRTAVYGKEVSKIRRKEEEYPINVRYDVPYKEDPQALLNHKISFRDLSDGRFKQIPISVVTSFSYGSGWGSIRRKDLKRTVTLSSQVLAGYNANEVNQAIRQALVSFPSPAQVSIRLGGEQQEQQKAAAFLQGAFGVALGLVLFILLAQFNSWAKGLIILSQVLFSLAGVLWGYGLSQMEFAVVLSGIGMVALIGVVVKNGILLVEFIDEMRHRGERTREAIIQGSKLRIRPVLLTAFSTILGLIPLAIGFNFDIVSLFETGDPKIFFGGDTVFFWKPLTATIIFGLGTATFITLWVVPVLYFLSHSTGIRWRRKLRKFLS
ncbi:MAG: efflux RND transporter permease subunit [Bacteroidia bacterium]